MISSCPRCQKQVSVPIDADPAAWVRCPWCEAEYALCEAMARVPPELILVAARAATGEKSTGENEAVDSETADAFPDMHDAARRPMRRRPSKSGPRLLLEVVFGGVAGIVVAYYGLAFYFGPQFHDLGFPQIPLPWIHRITAPRDDVRPEPPAEHPNRERDTPPAEK